MKKTKLLMPTILAVGALTATTPILASCKKDTSHIVEPTEEEKQLKPTAGALKATYSLTFNEDVEKADLTITLKNITKANEDLIKISSFTCANKKCDIVVEWNDRPFGETAKCSFDLSIVSTKGWTQEITGCSLTYTQPTTKYTITYELNGGTGTESAQVRYGDLVTQPADPTKDNYVFAGWYADSEFKTGFNFKETRTYADTKIYAKWIEDGKTVTSEQWDAAFAALADTRTALNFWTSGSMIDSVTYPNDEYWTGTLRDIVFNTDTESTPWKQKHYYLMDVKQKSGSIEEASTLATASEYCNNFYFSGTRTQSEGFTALTYDVDYETPTTNFFYKIYKLAKGNWDKFEFNSDTKAYDYKEASSDYKCSVRFNADLKVQHIDFYSRDVIAQGTIEKKTINSSFFYGKKEVQFPEGWDTYKAEATCNWTSTGTSCELNKSEKLNKGVIVPITISTADQAGTTKFKFVPYGFTKEFKDGDMAICVTRKGASESEWEIFDTTYWSTADGWEVQLLKNNPLALEDKVEILVKLQGGKCKFTGYMS